MAENRSIRLPINPEAGPIERGMPFFWLGGLSVLGAIFGLMHWGEPRTPSDGPLLGDLIAVVTLLGLVAMTWKRSTSPLRHPIAALMVGDTLRDTYLYTDLLFGFGGGTVSINGPIDLAIQLLWVGGVAVLYFDRPERDNKPRNVNEWPTA